LLLHTMTSPGTIKTIQKRIYTVVAPAAAIPRVRSNSASRSLYTAPSPFFDSPPPPPPSSRPGNPHVLSTSRLPVKGDASGTGGGGGAGENTNTGPHPPFSLALTSPQPNPSSSSSSSYNPPGSSTYYYTPGYPFFPYNTGLPVPFYSTGAEKEREEKKRLLIGAGGRYQLDVGAYGIAKRSRRGTGVWMGREEADDGLGLAVQVGEDAYFIRDNAMGVADGVGGWARRGACLFLN
jgi:hypothetical protein